MGRPKRKNAEWVKPFSWKLDSRLIDLIVEIAHAHERTITGEVTVALKAYAESMGKPFDETAPTSKPPVKKRKSKPSD